MSDLVMVARQPHPGGQVVTEGPPRWMSPPSPARNLPVEKLCPAPGDLPPSGWRSGSFTFQTPG